MDALSLFAALNAIGSHPTPPFWDDDLTELYRIKRAEAESGSSTRLDLAIGIAGLLERIAGHLRGHSDTGIAGAPRPSRV